jgi:hypothetical protein
MLGCSRLRIECTVPCHDKSTMQLICVCTCVERAQQTRDWKEGFDVGQPGKSEVDGENQWPSEPQQFRSAIEDYYEASHVLARALVRACALGLGMYARLHTGFHYAHCHAVHLHLLSSFNDQQRNVHSTPNQTVADHELHPSPFHFRARSSSFYRPATSFDKDMDPHTSYLRMNYYPICEHPAAENHPLDEPDPAHNGNLGVNKVGPRCTWVTSKGGSIYY